MEKRIAGVVAAVVILVLGASAGAAVITWTGATDTDFETAGNWSGTYTPPRNNDYSDEARFTENTPSNRTPTLTASRQINKINFADSTGWTLGGATLTLKSLSSTGAGTNTVSGTLKVVQGNYSWQVGEGNTLLLSKLIQDGSGRLLALQGGGTMSVTGGIQTAWSSAVNTFRIDSGTLIVDTATPYRYSGAANSGVVVMNGEDAVIELYCSATAAEAMIGTRITDATGQGLTVSDAGGGYSRVSVIPEPTTMGLLALGGLAAFSRRRR